MASYKEISDPHLGYVTLDSAYTAGSGSMTLTAGHGARLPASGDFWLTKVRSTINDTVYIYKVTARSTDTLTVAWVSAYGTDANHDAGATFVATRTVEAFDQLRQDICQTGTDATKSGEKAGQLHLPNDAIYESRYNGSAWDRWGPVWKCTEPALGDFSWVNQGSATADTSHGGIIICAPAHSGDDLKILEQSAPSTPYTIDAKFFVSGCLANYFNAGLVFRQSSDGKLATFGVGFSTNLRMCSVKWSNATTWTADYAAYTIYNPFTLFHFTLADNGTNRICSMSGNGYSPVTYHSVSRTDYLTADQVGFFADSANAAYPCYIHLIHWKVS